MLRGFFFAYALNYNIIAILSANVFYSARNYN
ncbi:hypothetical protein BafHLJ01_0243 [Borreliella afzelii HLJ01]|nr:hypothetical protein BafHLJ01_0243 [Borreliella afzelii HLJ01]